MRMKLREYRFIILAIFLVVGAAIAGWAFAFHYDNKMKSAGSQEVFKNDILAANLMPSALNHKKIISLLVCTGLVGFFGVRRKSNTMKKIVKKKRPEIKLRINLLRQDTLKSQRAHPWKTGCVAG